MCYLSAEQMVLLISDYCCGKHNSDRTALSQGVCPFNHFLGCPLKPQLRFVPCSWYLRRPIGELVWEYSACQW